MTAPELTPAQIVHELDKYIIGQHDAKKSVAIALRNRWRRMQAPPEIRREIMPNNILMIGSTGVGKTEIARRLAKLANAPFVKVEASKYTEVGYVGRDVESMVRDLAEVAVAMVRGQKKEEVRARAAEAVEDQLLDLLVPPIKQSTGFVTGGGKSSADEEIDPNTASDHALNERTREKFRVKLKNGELDDRKVEIEVSGGGPNVQVMGPMGMEAGMEQIQELISNMSPKKKKKRSVTIAEARDLLLDEEVQKHIDMDAVTAEAIDLAENNGIIFIDEIDKVASGGNKGGGADVSREGVQRDLLPIVEGSTVNTKYGSLRTDHVLFVAAGAFHVAKPSDLIPELQGRFPIRVELKPLTREDFVQILTQPQNALTRQYATLLESEGVSLTFEPDAIEELAELAWYVNQEVENIGARRLHTIMSTLLEEMMYQVPDQTDTRHIVVNRAYVQERLGRLAKSRDLSQFIL